MNVNQMLIEFESRFYSITHGKSRVFFTEEVEDFLNEAQDRIVKERAPSFEFSEHTRKELSNLVKRDTLLRVQDYSANQLGTFPNGVFFDLPEDLMYTIHEEATIDLDSLNRTTLSRDLYKRIEVQPVTYDQYAANIDNPFKSPYHDLAWRMMLEKDDTAGRHEVITDGTYNIVKYHITYLRRPVPMSIRDSVDCMLDESIHHEMVDRAVSIAVQILSLQEAKNQSTT